jgi:hypothetical protein
MSYADGELAYIGHTGTGFNGQTLLDVRNVWSPSFKTRARSSAGRRLMPRCGG